MHDLPNVSGHSSSNENVRSTKDTGNQPGLEPVRKVTLILPKSLVRDVYLQENARQ